MSDDLNEKIHEVLESTSKKITDIESLLNDSKSSKLINYILYLVGIILLILCVLFLKFIF